MIMEIPYLMPHQMEPFNGDRFIEQEFLKLRDQYRIDTVIETGTCLGSTTRFLAQHFQRVISMDINEQYLEIARSVIGSTANVLLYKGASEDILDKVLKDQLSIGDSILFFLDAHWGSHCPLTDELRIIAQNGVRPVIAIHDFQVPGQPGLHFDSYAGQPFTFDWLKPYLDSIYTANGYSYYYNSEMYSTEIRIGIIYIVPINEK